MIMLYDLKTKKDEALMLCIQLIYISVVADA
jgi:hypothetical protein